MGYLPTARSLSLGPFVVESFNAKNQGAESPRIEDNRWFKFMKRIAAPDAADVRVAMVAMHQLRTGDTLDARRAAAAWADETLQERARVISAT